MSNDVGGAAAVTEDRDMNLVLAYMRKLFEVPPCEVCGQPGRLVSFGDVSVYLCSTCTPDDRNL